MLLSRVGVWPVMQGSDWYLVEISHVPNFVDILV